MDLDDEVAAVLLPGWAASPPTPAPEVVVVGGGEQLVAAVAAGSAASPPSPAPEMAVAGLGTNCLPALRRARLRRRCLPLAGRRSGGG